MEHNDDPNQFIELGEAILKRLNEGIPPCPTCGNTNRDFWAIDVFTSKDGIEVCLICGLERPIIERKAH